MYVTKYFEDIYIKPYLQSRKQELFLTLHDTVFVVIVLQLCNTTNIFIVYIFKTTQNFVTKSIHCTS